MTTNEEKGESFEEPCKESRSDKEEEGGHRIPWMWGLPLIWTFTPVLYVLWLTYTPDTDGFKSLWFNSLILANNQLICGMAVATFAFITIVLNFMATQRPISSKYAALALFSVILGIVSSLVAARITATTKSPSEDWLLAGITLFFSAGPLIPVALALSPLT